MPDTTTELAITVAGTKALATPTSLELATLTYDEWQQVGERLALAANWSQWAIGDWWLHGEKNFGDEAFNVDLPFTLAIHTLQNYATVASRFEPSRRRESVPFALHAELASLPPEEADRWLDIVEANGWTREELREARRMEKRREDEENGTLALPAPLHFFGLCEVSGGGAWISGAPAADYLRQFSGWEIEVTVKAVKEEPDDD